MRRIAIINQKGGVGKTTTVANLGAALALAGRRVVVIDLDPQANLSLHLDVPAGQNEPSIYTVLSGETSLADALRPTKTPNLSIVSSNIDLSGAELELASAIGRESLLRDAIDAWEREAREKSGRPPAEYLLIDCPPSLGLLSINGLVATSETIVTLQTEFFALQGMTKLIEVLKLLQKRLNPGLTIAGILPCMYDSRLKLGREVLAEIKSYFPGRVFSRAIGKNVKLAEAPSYGRTIFEYAPECSGASDYRELALELLHQEARDPDLAELPRPARAGVASAVEKPASAPATLNPPGPPKVRRAPKDAAPSVESTEVGAAGNAGSAGAAAPSTALREIEIVPVAPPTPQVSASGRETTNGHAHDAAPGAELDSAREPALAVVRISAPSPAADELKASAREASAREASVLEGPRLETSLLEKPVLENRLTSYGFGEPESAESALQLPSVAEATLADEARAEPAFADEALAEHAVAAEPPAALPRAAAVLEVAELVDELPDLPSDALLLEDDASNGA